MHYTSFTIRDYRAISAPLQIDLHKSSLIPIIGVNECGKSTILNALFAFDYYNDNLNEDGRQLKDTAILYSTIRKPAIVSAKITVSQSELLSYIKAIKSEPHTTTQRSYVRKRKHYLSELTIERDLATKNYRLLHTGFDNESFNNLLAREIISRLPYILYFDDFRDSIEDRIEIVGVQGENHSGWLSIIERLFIATDKAFSVFDLSGMEDRLRRTILAKVKRRLNVALTAEWQNFRLDDREALEISVDYIEETVSGSLKKFIKLDLIERDGNGDEHYFFIRDRSKGFYWFFNFVMKLEFTQRWSACRALVRSTF